MKELSAELTKRARTGPDEVVVVDATGAHTAAEVVAEATGLAQQLETTLGGSPTVLVQADNSWRTLASAVAVGLRGGLMAVTSRHAHASEIALALDDLRPDAVVASDETLASWQLPASAFPTELSALAGWRLRAGQGPVSDVGRWVGGSVVAMTSGSTGRPKCVIQSEDALWYAGRCTIETVRLRPGDPVAALVPWSSVAAFCFGMYLPARLGSPAVCLDKWNPAQALSLMREHDVRWTMLVPTMALQLSVQPGAEGSLRSLTAMTVGGGPMDASALRRAETLLDARFFACSACRSAWATPRRCPPTRPRCGWAETDGRSPARRCARWTPRDVRWR
nr:class I adenylate-forming enzyme family protein [Allosalinactinospora lopnorensis]